MERRRFLQSVLGGLLATHVLDVDKLLWVPGKKRIFIPPVPKLVVVTDIDLADWYDHFDYKPALAI